jgi:hypothetical protein
MNKKIGFDKVFLLFIKWLLDDMILLKAIIYGIVGGIIGLIAGNVIAGVIPFSIIGGVIGYLSKKQIYFFKKKTPKVNNNGYYPNYNPKVRQQYTASISPNPNFSTKAEPPPYFSTWSFVDDSSIAKQEYLRESQNRGVVGSYSSKPSIKRMQQLAGIKEEILSEKELANYVD